MQRYLYNRNEMSILKCAAQPLDPDPTDMAQELKRFWELESLGVFPYDESVYERFTQSIKLSDKQYEVELPWKESHLVLPDNYDLETGRIGGVHYLPTTP